MISLTSGPRVTTHVSTRTAHCSGHHALHLVGDGHYHHAGALQLAVDTIFTTSAYSTSSFEVLEGLSDHKALLATLIP
ncbi:MAG: hypothetical protein ABW136_00755 [Steroidobacteraceae bacterium]